MKIAVISFGYNQKTGIELFTDNMMKQIGRIDGKNQYILIVNEKVQGFYESTQVVSKKIVGAMARSQILKALWLLFVYPVYSLIEGIDVTIVFSGTSNFSASPFTKNIVFIHDLGEFYIENKYDRKRMIYRKYLSLPLNKMMADIFVAVSESTRKSIIEKLHVAKEKICLIYNGADERIRKADKVGARRRIIEKYGIGINDRIILTVGRIDPVGKNLMRLAEAMGIVGGRNKKDYHLFLVGGASNYSSPDLLPEEIRKRGLDDYITMTGYVDTDVLNDFYNAADLLVFPSVHEGFGLPIVEAMKCGLPVACSDIAIFHEIGDDAVVYFDPYNAQDIAGKIELLCNNNSLREELINKGGKRFPLFTWDNSAKELFKLLN